ncbi:MAG TPA: alpha/beta hydrolase [Acidimicrobiia bacterium]|nr:alpha/beta hydrolase [Acidimicrobiia bacterium]
MTSDIRSTPRDLLDPEVAEAADLVPFDDLSADVLGNLRSVGPIEVPLSDAVEQSEAVVPGDPEVPMRVHRPKGFDGVLPCVYSMHGGGYVIGSYAMDDPLFDELCPELGFVGVSVDYRLAPETPYPGPVEDCYRGLRWVHDHADELGIDSDRIGVMGVSAGGGLAAALCLLARDRGEMSVAFQLLDSPMLDDRQLTPSSRQDGLPVWSRSSNTFGWRSYLGDLYGRDDVPPTAAPARATDLMGLPPAFVSVGAVDGFRDEDVDYALHLNRAGVAAELHVYPGACHGFFHLAPDAPVTQQCKRNMEDWLRRQLGAGR